MILGIAGPYASGKGEAMDYLAERGFQVLSLSDILRDELRRENVEESRERMIAIGRRLREEEGMAVLAERTLVRCRPEGDYAIDSIRHPAEVEALASGGRGFHLLWIDADAEVRYARLRGRGRIGDPATFAHFQELEGRELRSDAEAGQQLLAVCERAEHRLRNDGGLAELHDQLQGLLERLGWKPTPA